MGDPNILEKGIFKFFGDVFSGMIHERKITSNPAEYTRYFLRKAHLKPVPPLDTDSIWARERFQPHYLLDSDDKKCIFNNFFTTETQTKTFPVTTITQIFDTSSTVTHGNWKSIKAFGEHVYQKNAISEKDNITNIVHRLLGDKKSITIHHYSWSDEYICNTNTDGAHLLAIACYHASDDAPVEIPASITSYSFNSAAFDTYRKKGGMIWVVHHRTFREVIRVLGKKIPYSFNHETYSYPLRHTDNIIIRITNDFIDLNCRLEENSSVAVPFDTLFKTLGFTQK